MVGVYFKKRKKGEVICLFKAVLQEFMIREMNSINRDGEGKTTTLLITSGIISVGNNI